MNFRGIKSTVFVCLAVLIASCSVSEFAEKIIPVEAQAQMMEIMDGLAEKDYVFVASKMESAFDDKDTAVATLEEVIQPYLYVGTPLETKITGASANTSLKVGEKKVSEYVAVYNRKFDEGENIFTFSFRKTGDEMCCEIYGLNVDKKTNAEIEAAKLSFTKVGPLHYVVIFLLFLLFAFIVFIVKSRKQKRMSEEG